MRRVLSEAYDVMFVGYPWIRFSCEPDSWDSVDAAAYRALDDHIASNPADYPADRRDRTEIALIHPLFIAQEAEYIVHP